MGRLLAGALGGNKRVDALTVNNISLVLAGAAVLSLPWATKHYCLVIFCVVFGLCVGK